MHIASNGGMTAEPLTKPCMQQRIIDVLILNVSNACHVYSLEARGPCGPSTLHARAILEQYVNVIEARG